MNNNFLLVNADTDSITICKNDLDKFTKDEINNLIFELNSLFSDNIKWEDDGYYDKFIVLKAKNYITFQNNKIKLKGSSLKDQKKEPALKEMLNKMIEDLVYNEGNSLVNIYHTYIKEANNVIDIKRWSQKKTITKAILNCATNKEARKNETDVWDAIKDKQVQEGDKVYVYPAILNSITEIKHFKNGKTKEKITETTGLKTYQDWNNDHSVKKLIKRVVDTVEILSNVVDSSLFVDYTKKENNELLEKL